MTTPSLTDAPPSVLIPPVPAPPGAPGAPGTPAARDVAPPNADRGPDRPFVPVTPEPGDVLLFNGKGWLPKAIMFFTQSDVNHAAIYLGDGMVGEAVAEGVVRRPVDVSYPGHPWVVARRLADDQPLQPVLDRASFYLDQRVKYAYQQLVLLAILLLVKRVQPSGVLGRLVVAASRAAAKALNDMLHGDTQLMICSEFVYRAYDEATGGTPDPFAIALGDGAAGAARAVDSGPAAGRAGAAGSGVEPGSILDNLRAHPELLPAAGATRDVAPAEPPREVLEAEVERLVEEHMAEVGALGDAAAVRAGQPAARDVAPAQPVDDRTIAAAITHFGERLQATRSAGARPAAASRDVFAPGQLPPALAALFTTPADFVTPADLQRTASLRDVGRVA